jgi:hypothetical protein
MINRENALGELINYQQTLIQNEKLFLEDINNRRQHEFSLMMNAEVVQIKARSEIQQVQEKLKNIEEELIKIQNNIYQYFIKTPFLQGQISHSSEYIKALEYNIEKLKDEKLGSLIPNLQMQIEEQTTVLKVVSSEIEEGKLEVEILRTKELQLKKDLEMAQKQFIIAKDRLTNILNISSKAEINFLQMAVLTFGIERKLANLEKVREGCLAESIRRISNNEELSTNRNISIENESSIVSLNNLSLNSRSEGVSYLLQENPATSRRPSNTTEQDISKNISAR